MGCCYSTSATRASAGIGQPAAPATDALVITEVTAHERAIIDLKRIFEGASANEQGHASKAELIASLEKEQALNAVLKEAEMNEILEFVNRIAMHGKEFVSWDEFMMFAAKAVCLQAAEDVKETIVNLPATIVQETKKEVEEFKQEVAADVEAAEKALQASVEAGEKAMQWLKQRFDSLTADEEGAVSKEELATKVKETEDVDGQSIGTLVGLAGFNPLYHAVEQLDTNKDGNISWEEFKTHVCGTAKEEKVEVVLEETAVKPRCWACC